MKSEVDYWKSYWGNKTEPLHTYSDKAYYQSYGKELSILLPPDCSDGSVLDLGCGSGSLYEPLGFHKVKNYTGVDLSQSMLNEFQLSHPEVTLVEGSADAYKDNKKYDLVFTNGVIQYLSLDMLRKQIGNALDMLTESGTIIHCSIPWNIMRKNYCSGAVMPPFRGFSIKTRLYYWMTTFGLKKDKLGRWYSIEDIEMIAKEFGLTAKFYGSMYYPYRFHVVLNKV